MCAALAVALVAALAPAAASAATETSAIIGGTVAATGTLTSLAQVSVQLPDGTGIGCSGTVVAPRLVLTAGHCAEDLTTGTHYTAGEFSVITGAVNIDSSSAQQSSVTKVIVDPSYAPPSESGDAALLVLATPTRAPAIKLATAAQAADPAGPLTGGTAALMAGWGRTTATSDAAPRLLREAATVVQSDATCDQAWGTSFDAGSELCALNTTSETTSACGGDSGGPLLATSDGVTVEIGIAIFVDEGCSTTVPDVFTRADTLQGWVAAEAATVAHSAASRRLAQRRALHSQAQRRAMRSQAQSHSARR